MKKLLLTVASAFALTFANAQNATNAEIAENLPTTGNTGFEYLFRGDPAKKLDDGLLNCLRAGGERGTTGIWGDVFGNGAAGYNASGYAFSYDTLADKFYIESNGSQTGPVSARILTGNCGAYFGGDASSRVNLTGVNNQVQVKVTSDVDVALEIMAATLDGGLEFADGTEAKPRPVFNLKANQTVVVSGILPGVNFQNVARSMDKVIGLGFKIVGTSAAKINIEYLRLGDAVILGDNTSSSDVSFASKMVISPNPAKDFFSVEKGASVRMFNSNGVMVKEVNSSEGSVAVNDLNAGIYMVQVANNGKVYNNKLIVE